MASLSTTIKKAISRWFNKPLARIIIDEGWGVEDEKRERWMFYKPFDAGEFPLTAALVWMKITSKKRRLVLKRTTNFVYYDGIRLGVWKAYNPDELPRLEINERARPRGLIR